MTRFNYAIGDDNEATVTTMPNGIASGDTTFDSTVLWTRSTELVEVTFEYSTSPDFI